QLELGYFARADQVTASQQRVAAQTGIPYKMEKNLESTLTDIGLYGDLNVRALPWLSLRGGPRVDFFGFNVNNLCAAQDVTRPSKANPPGDASCLTQQSGGDYREPNQRASTASVAILPRASVLFGPFRGFTYSLSYGEGVRSIDPVYITQDV